MRKPVYKNLKPMIFALCPAIIPGLYGRAEPEPYTALKGGNSMELTKELREQLENAKTEEEAKKIMEEVDLEMTDDAVETVAGGCPHYGFRHQDVEAYKKSRS